MKIRIRGNSKKGSMLCKLTHNGFQADIIDCRTNMLARVMRNWYNQEICELHISTKEKLTMLKNMVKKYRALSINNN